MEHSLQLLKLRLLLHTLDQVPASESHALLIQEASVAEAKAIDTSFPELVFPCLFQERVVAALELDQRRNRNYWRLETPTEESSTVRLAT